MYLPFRNTLRFGYYHSGVLSGIFLTPRSARMDVYKRGGDSLMGRYFPYRMHPFSVAELIDASLPGERLVRAPRKLPPGDWAALLEFGGFPEPFSRRNRRFSSRWNRLRDEQLLRDDVRDLSRVAELGQLSVLAELLRNRSGEQIVYRSLAGEVKADEKTVKSWTDLGYGEFELHYIRDKQKREVDFLVSRDKEPWFLVEAKTSDDSPTKTLRAYQKTLGAAHAFQVVRDAPFARFDCFAERSPVSVPALTFLSQLL